jgi:hypothetical protein
MGAFFRTHYSKWCALAFAGLLVPLTVHAETDDRPIYYLMLESLEARVMDMSAALEKDYQQRSEALKQRYEAAIADRELARQRIDDDTRAQLDSFKRRAASLESQQQRISAGLRELESDAAPDAESSARMLAELKEIKTALTANVERIQEVRRTYRTRSDALSSRHQALTALTEALRAGDHELTRRLREVRVEHQRMVDDSSSRLNARIRAFNQQRQGFDEWLESERASLRGQAEAYQSGAATYQNIKVEYDTLLARQRQSVARYNDLVTTASDSSLSRSQREAARQELPALKLTFDSDKARLQSLGEEVTKLNAALSKAQRDQETRLAALEAEKVLRRDALSNERTRIEAKRERVRADIVDHEQQTRTEIETIEAEIDRTLDAAGNDYATAARNLVRDFGEHFEAVDQAVESWRADRGGDALYTDRRSRFDLAPPVVAELYAYVERVAALDAEAWVLRAGISSRDISEAQRAELVLRLQAERQRTASELEELISAASRLKQASHNKLEAWHTGLLASQASWHAKLAAFKGLYETKFELTEIELTRLQSVLLSAVRDQPATAVSQTRFETLLAALREHATRLDEPVPPDLLAADQLFRALSVTRNATGGSDEQPRWSDFDQQSISNRRVLSHDEKLALADLWYRVLESSGQFNAQRKSLEALYPAAGSERVRVYIFNLFSDGVLRSGNISEHRFTSGGVAIEVEILGVKYWLRQTGGLERASNI